MSSIGRAGAASGDQQPVRLGPDADDLRERRSGPGGRYEAGTSLLSHLKFRTQSPCFQSACARLVAESDVDLVPRDRTDWISQRVPFLPALQSFSIPASWRQPTHVAQSSQHASSSHFALSAHYAHIAQLADRVDFSDFMRALLGLGSRDRTDPLSPIGAKAFPMDSGNYAQWAAVFMSAIIATLAIWGEWLRTLLAGPKNELSLRPGTGDLHFSKEGKRILYHHILVQDHRRWSPVKHFRLLVEKIERRGPMDAYFAESLIHPLVLRFPYNLQEADIPDIGSPTACDLGSLDETRASFQLTTYLMPGTVNAAVRAGEVMRVHIVAAGHNFRSKPPLILEISWDGQWSDLSEMSRHLVIKEQSR
jgi:hypothetical protein